MKHISRQAVPAIPGQSCELDIRSLGSGGEGVGRLDGFTVFVPGALPGERVRARIEEAKPQYATGKLLEILRESADRAEPRCAVYGACGGCQLQHLSYGAQLKAKRWQVIDAVTRIGRRPDLFVEETIGAPDPWNYRNKMQFPVGRSGGHAVVGCFARGSHDIVGTDCCHIQREPNNLLANAVRDIVDRLRIPVYDEERHAGVLRHVMGRVGMDGELMAVLVTATERLPHAKDIVRILREALPGLASVHQNIQTYRNNVILGRETRLLWGSPVIRDRIGSLVFRISPRSFFQVHTAQAEALCRVAMEYAGLSGAETAIDAYCGTGTLALAMAQKARKVYGIEIVKPAVLDARQNARDNHIKNAEFLVGDASVFLPKLCRQGIHPDAVLVDPPRAGCTQEALGAIARMGPARIVYVSCNPATLARDIAVLDGMGYTARRVQPVDMFPHSSHVESVTRFERKDGLQENSQ